MWSDAIPAAPDDAGIAEKESEDGAISMGPTLKSEDARGPSVRSRSVGCCWAAARAGEVVPVAARAEPGPAATVAVSR